MFGKRTGKHRRNTSGLAALYSNTDAEVYRTIRTNIQFLANIRDAKTILVTSAKPEEGKSTVLSNLGIVFAQSGKRVLLIDGDLRKPTLHQLFKLSNLNGLSNYLIGQCTAQECIMSTNVEDLFVLPSGTIPPNPSELLASPKFKERLRELEMMFDHVFIDSPPVLSVADPLVLTQVVDGVIFLINAKRTTIPIARKALKTLQHLDAKVLGILANRISATADEYSYDSDYGSSST